MKSKYLPFALTATLLLLLPLCAQTLFTQGETLVLKGQTLTIRKTGDSLELNLPVAMSTERHQKSGPRVLTQADVFVPGESFILKGRKLFVAKVGETLLLVPQPAPTESIGAFIQPVGVEAQGGTPLAMINGTGLSETFPGSRVFVHTNDGYEGGGSMWTSNYRQRPDIVFDLGKTHRIAGAYIWNCNASRGYNRRSIRQMTISVSDDKTAWREVMSATLKRADGNPGLVAEAIAFPQPMRARYVRFQPHNNYWSDSEPVGLSEVRFADADVTPKSPLPQAWKPKYPRSTYPDAKRGAVVKNEFTFRPPEDFGHLDITKPPYNAKGDGVTDDTAAIQSALARERVIYFPNGTYLISDVLCWPENSTRLVFQGESRSGTVIRLKDNAVGFQNTNEPRPMIWTGNLPAQRFGNELRDLTLDSGIGNPGAVGVKFIANNFGGIKNVDIVSGDGRGVIGLDLSTSEQGPCFIRQVRVQGFDTGVYLAHGVNSVTFENLALSYQNSTGFLNAGQPVSIRKLDVRNVSGPAVLNRSGHMVMLDSTLHGAGETGLVNNATLLLRDSKITGYTVPLSNHGEDVPASGGMFREFLSKPGYSLSTASVETLRLPVKESPIVPLEDPSKWVNVNNFEQDDDICNAAAFQRAIDSGAKTVYIPRGDYKLNAPVLVRGNVERIIACHPGIKNAPGIPLFRVVDGKAPVVTIERVMEWNYRKAMEGNIIEVDTKRTVVLESIGGAAGDHLYTGGGEVFVNDVVLGHLKVGGGTKVWARQLNSEPQGLHIDVEDGDLWVLGLKTEKLGTIGCITGKSRMEILGGLVYNNSGENIAPMFITDGAPLVLSLTEAHFGHKPYTTIIEQTMGGRTETLRNDHPMWHRSPTLLRAGRP